jgi:hypothetical protein
VDITVHIKGVKCNKTLLISKTTQTRQCILLYYLDITVHIKGIIQLYILPVVGASRGFEAFASFEGALGLGGEIGLELRALDCLEMLLPAHIYTQYSYFPSVHDFIHSRGSIPTCVSFWWYSFGFNFLGHNWWLLLSPSFARRSLTDARGWTGRTTALGTLDWCWRKQPRRAIALSFFSRGFRVALFNCLLAFLFGLGWNARFIFFQVFAATITNFKQWKVILP